MHVVHCQKHAIRDFAKGLYTLVGFGLNVLRTFLLAFYAYLGALSMQAFGYFCTSQDSLISFYSESFQPVLVV